MRIDPSPKSKNDILKTIAEMVAETDLVPAYSADQIFSALRGREEIGSTGFEHGIAISYCGRDQMDEFVAGILIVPSGVDFQSADSTPSTIFAFIVGPRNERNRHIQLLSAVSRMLSDQSAASAFRTAESEEMLWQLPARHIGEMDGVVAPPEAKPKNLFTIVVQREEYFDDILRIFTAAVHGIANKPGVMIAVQELAYTNGLIEF